jgi:methylenetetrahydrofolate reductase (NADPH)
MQGQGLRSAAHLTCIGASRAEIHEIADAYWLAGIRHIVALRGDLPDGYSHPADGYHTAAQLVTGLKARHPFEVSVGGYPEMHPESVSTEADMVRLKEKVDAGADRIITQFFFDNALFFAFVERARAAGITVPIMPGLLPIANFAKTASFAEKCKASIPQEFAARFAGFDEKPVEARHEIAVAALRAQAAGLVAGGVSHLHFYTLNRAEIILDACHELA